MKRVKTKIILSLLVALASGLSLSAQEPEPEVSREALAYLLGLSEPAGPEVIGNTVVFTASGELRRVGIAFAVEGFARVHWFRPLRVSQDPLETIRMGRRATPHRDSGISFHIYEIPEGVTSIEYRLVVNGLWTTDTSNPDTRRQGVSSSTVSVISLPPKEPEPRLLRDGGLDFVFRGPPGENVTVAGSFNNWDPFMYELREARPGVYTLRVPLPPGRHQYVFFHRGERIVDPGNPSVVFSREGEPVSEVFVQ
ncbi:MAG: glycogen-binding domain-containing protein [Treponema sp.]|nr:glycogen-binding domain-containing protein [Treponema sp.]